MADNATQSQTAVNTPRMDPGMWMGILALTGMLCLSIVAVSFVFMARDKGGVMMPPPSSDARPIIVNNVIPQAQPQSAALPADAQGDLTGKPAAGATRAPADSEYINAIPGKLASPTPQAGKREVFAQRSDPAPPPYEKPTSMEGYSVRRVRPSPPGNVRGPLPNRIAASDNKVNTSMPGFAIPSKVPSGTNFSSAAERRYSAVTAQAGALRVTVSQLKSTGEVLPPHGYRPLAGHEFLVADLEISSTADEDIALDANSIWASEASDPDMGYYQNPELLNADFPVVVAPGQSIRISSAIVFLSSSAPGSLVVQPLEGEEVRLPIR